MSFSIKDKVVTITGGGGTIGVPLAKQLLKKGAKTVRLLDQDDSSLTFAYDALNKDSRVRLFLGKIEDQERLERAFAGVDIVFHLAAVKHVMVAEYNPFDTINTNVNATQNVIVAALKTGVKKVIFSSSDKAVNPPNTYGSTKLLGEKLIIAANLSKGSTKTTFSSVRFGNIIGSRGSVIPRFKEQLKSSGKIYVTDPEMTRFIMFLEDAVELLINACEISKGGEIFVLKMYPIKLGDLCELFLEHYSKDYPNAEMEIIGLFEGEKRFEELIDLHDELGRTYEIEGMYVIKPSYSEISKHFPNEDEIENNKEIIKTQLSSSTAKPIEKSELKELIIENKIFE